MINLEILRLELNYLEQIVKGILGDKVSGEIGEAIKALTLYFLNPATYNSLSLSNIQTIEQYLNQIQQKTEPYEYKLMLNNIPTIRNFLEKVKFEIPKC
jgi:conjugal transfer/entry exclusion protein